MDRFMVHLKNSHYTPQDANRLLQQARRLISQTIATIRDTRVSSRYLEYDVSIPLDDLDDIIKRLEPIAVLDHAKHIIEEDIPKDAAVRDGVFYFNTERFWECHEVLEGVWKKCQEGEKDLVQGIILVAAGLVHFQKNEDAICLSIFNRAMQKLINSSGMYYDIDVDKLRGVISKMISSETISTFEI